MEEKIISKWPSDKTVFDTNWQKIFNQCGACKGRGYHYDYCKIQDRWLKTICLICNGTGAYYDHTPTHRDRSSDA